MDVFFSAWSRTFALNQNVSFLPNKMYKCTGEYTFEKNTTKSEEIPVNITCGKLLRKMQSFIWLHLDAVKVCLQMFQELIQQTF